MSVRLVATSAETVSRGEALFLLHVPTPRTVVTMNIPMTMTNTVMNRNGKSENIRSNQPIPNPMLIFSLLSQTTKTPPANKARGVKSRGTTLLRPPEAVLAAGNGANRSALLQIQAKDSGSSDPRNSPTGSQRPPAL